jgi:hypothetical protein
VVRIIAQIKIETSDFNTERFESFERSTGLPRKSSMNSCSEAEVVTSGCLRFIDCNCIPTAIVLWPQWSEPLVYLFNKPQERYPVVSVRVVRYKPDFPLHGFQY